MQRQTPLDSSLRGFVSGGARGTVHEADDKRMMQEVKVNFMKGETREKVEHPQNYGFTSYCIKAEYGNDGQIEKCAEHFTQFMTGNRAFPVVSVLDDRRYRLRNFKEGEAAVYDDQQQKVHIQRDRIYTRSQYKVEMRVIKDQPKMEGHGKHIDADRDQQKDKSRRWSTYVMDKDTITIERTDIVNDDDKKSGGNGSSNGSGSGTGTEKKGKSETQDEPEQHIKMLSRVFLDKLHVHVLTPSISTLWDEEKKQLTIKTRQKNEQGEDEKYFSTIVMDDVAQTITLKTENEETSYLNTITMDNAARKITLQTEDKSNGYKNTVVMDSNAQTITVKAGEMDTVAMNAQQHSIISTANTRNIMQTPNTGVHCNEPGNVVHVGEVWATVPAAMQGSIDTAGHKIIQRLAQKVLVK